MRIRRYLPILNCMDTKTLKYLKYEIALNSPIPMPQPEIDYFKGKQHSVQQFLYMLCKKNVGSLGKKDGRWEFGDEAHGKGKASSRPDITEFFDAFVELGIIVPKPPDGTAADADGVFIPYELTESYAERFAKLAS